MQDNESMNPNEKENQDIYQAILENLRQPGSSVNTGEEGMSYEPPRRQAPPRYEENQESMNETSTARLERPYVEPEKQFTLPEIWKKEGPEVDVPTSEDMKRLRAEAEVVKPGNKKVNDTLNRVVQRAQEAAGFSTPGAGASDDRKGDILSTADAIKKWSEGSPDTTGQETALANAMINKLNATEDVQDQETREQLLHSLGKLAAGVVGLVSLKDHQSRGLDLGGLHFDKTDFKAKYDRLYNDYMLEVKNIERKAEADERAYERKGKGLQILAQLEEHEKQRQFQREEAEKARAARGGGGGGASKQEAAEQLAELKSQLKAEENAAKAAAKTEADAQAMRGKAQKDFAEIGEKLSTKKIRDPELVVTSMSQQAIKAGVPSELVAKIMKDSAPTNTLNPASWFGDNINDTYRKLNAEIAKFPQGSVMMKDPSGNSFAVSREKLKEFKQKGWRPIE